MMHTNANSDFKPSHPLLEFVSQGGKFFCIAVDRVDHAGDRFYLDDSIGRGALNPLDASFDSLKFFHESLESVGHFAHATALLDDGIDLFGVQLNGHMADKITVFVDHVTGNHGPRLSRPKLYKASKVSARRSSK